MSLTCVWKDSSNTETTYTCDTYPELYTYLTSTISPASVYEVVLSGQGTEGTGGINSSVWSNYSWSGNTPWNSMSNLKSLNVSNLDTSNLTTFNYFFAYLKLTQDNTIIGINNLNTSNVITMKYTFCEAFNSNDSSKRYELNLSNWVLSSVTSMQYMFYNSGSGKLRKITGTKKWDTSNLIYMQSLFYCQYYLEEVDVSSWNTKNVTNMANVFNRCEALKNVDVSAWNTSNVTDMYGMFYSCSRHTNIKSINISNFNTKNVINMSYMFTYCKLECIILGDLDISSLTYCSQMFQACYDLTTIVSNTDFNKSSITNSENMFLFCYELKGAIEYDSSKIDKTYANTEGYFTPSQKINFIKLKDNYYQLSGANQSEDGGATYTAGENIQISASNVISATDTTYRAASTTTDGLMSSSDKTKLNGIEQNANNYVLPTADISTLGGVKPDGTTITIQNGVISANTKSAKGIIATLNSSNWSNYSYLLSVSGVTSESIIFISPTENSVIDWESNGVRCAAQGTNTLTFSCMITPTSDIEAQIVILG